MTEPGAEGPAHEQSQDHKSEEEYGEGTDYAGPEEIEKLPWVRVTRYMNVEYMPYRPVDDQEDVENGKGNDPNGGQLHYYKSIPNSKLIIQMMRGRSRALEDGLWL